MSSNRPLCRDQYLAAAIRRVAKTDIDFAKLLELKRQAIYFWRRCPVERVLEVEKLTRVPRWQLAPTIYPPEDYVGVRRLPHVVPVTQAELDAVCEDFDDRGRARILVIPRDMPASERAPELRVVEAR